MPSSQTIPLPKKWPKHVKSALIHTLSLATTVFMAAVGQVSQKRVARRTLCILFLLVQILRRGIRSVPFTTLSVVATRARIRLSGEPPSLAPPSPLSNTYGRGREPFCGDVPQLSNLINTSRPNRELPWHSKTP